MKLRESASLLVVCFAVVLGMARAAAADEDVEKQLKSEYLNKVLTLRHFYIGEHLSFAVDGSLIGVGEIGPWTVNAQVHVKSIELLPHSVHIEGRRVCLAFDVKANPYRDVLDLIDESEPDINKRKALEEYFLNNNVDIKIDLSSEQSDLSEISAGMEAVFLKTNERIADIVPDYWQDYFSQVEGWPSAFPHSRDTVYKVRMGEVSTPRPNFQPAAEFTEEARRSRYHGTVTLSVVVDASGNVAQLAITSPAGMGLDEKAVEAIRTWKFEPAMKDARPVPVAIAIETQFDLY